MGMVVDYTTTKTTMSRFDWTTMGFTITKPWYYEEDDRNMTITVPIPGMTKKDVSVRKKIGGFGQHLLIDIPDSRLSDKRELLLEIGDGYRLKKAKANVREGVLYVIIPRDESSLPEEIEIE
jgi:HSP20 family molecular chaperone IbpA